MPEKQTEPTADEIFSQIEATAKLDEVKQYIKTQGNFDEVTSKAFNVLELKLGVAGTLPEEHQNKGGK